MTESLHILILEDNPADAELVQFELQEAGLIFTSKVVMTKNDFIHELQTSSPDLILSDYDLPNYNGALALAEAKKRCPDVPFILVTGAVGEDRAIEILTQGAKDYVLKNRLQQRLGPAVRRALAEAQEHKERKKAEEELKASSLYSRSLIEASLDPLVTISLDGKVMDVNKASEEITGVSREQIIGKDFSDYFTEPKKARAGYQKVFLEGSVKDYPLAIRHISGSVTQVLYNATVYKNEKGEVQGVFAAARDVTELKRTEAELREAHGTLEEQVKSRTAELEATISSMATGLIVYNMAGKAIRMNDTANRLLPQEIFFNKTIDERAHIIRWETEKGQPFPPEEIPVALALHGETSHNVILAASFPAHKLWISASAAPIRSDDGQMLGVVASFIDITASKHAEALLQDSEKRYRRLFEAAKDGILILDANTGMVDDVNPFLLQLLGYSYDELHGKHIWELGLFKDIAASREAFKTLQDNEYIRYEDLPLETRDGNCIAVEFVSNVYLVDHHKVIQCNIRDITEHKLINEEKNRIHNDLQNEKDRLQALINGITDEIWFTDIQKQFTLANPSALNEFGLNSHAAAIDIQKFAESFEVYRPDGSARPAEEAPPLRALAGEIVKNQEEMVRTPATGQIRYRQVSSNPVRDAGGQIMGSVSVVRDITERKWAEEALRQSEERYRALFNSLLEGYCIIEMVFDAVGKPVDYRFLEFNPAFEEQTGLHEAQGKLIRELAPEHEEHWFEIYGKVALTGEPAHFENEANALNRKYEVNAFRVGGEKSRKVAICFTDISERKNREKEQERYNRTLQALTKSSQAMMYATDECKYMNEVCKIIVEDCGHAMVWIGFAQEDEGKTVHPVAHSGFEEGYIDTLKITWADTERGRGPTGMAIRTGKTTTCKNMLTDPRFEPWRKEAIKRGYASSIVLPLMVDGKAFGALTIYSKEPDPFSEDEVKLLAELANDLSHGITAIRLRKALKESEERFHAIAANTPDHILVQDSDLRYQLVINPQIGLTETDMLGKTDYDILELRDADKLTAIKRKVLETGDSVSLESSLRNSRGELEYFEGAYVPRSGPNGQTDGVIGYFRNITKRRRIEEAILRAKEEWERTFDTIPDLIAILDKEHRVVRVNKAMAERLRLSPDQCFGLRCYEAVHGLSCPPEFCPHTLTCRDGGEHTAEVHEAILGGDFLVSTTPLCDSEGQLIGSVHVARDITKRKAAEDQLAKQASQLQEHKAQLEEINSELESFSYSVSHDLRAPLRAIDGFSRIILRQQGDKFDEKTRHQFNLIRDNIKLMGVLIENLLSFSRVQKTSMSISVIDMDKLARDEWNEIKAANKERKLNFKITNIKPGYGDLTLIRQVLFNLFSNAVKFTKNEKRSIIEMNSYIESDKTVYCIKDNGAGFDMAHYDKLFGVFQRLHNNEEYEGTGIGLAIVQRIINRHDGRVWANGEVGKGATFCFTLNSVPIDATPEYRRKRKKS